MLYNYIYFAKVGGNSIKKIKDIAKEKCLLIEGILFLCIILCIVLIIIYIVSSEEKISVLKKDFDNEQIAYENMKNNYWQKIGEISDKEKEIRELQQEDRKKEVQNNIKTLENKQEELTKEKETLESQVTSLKQDVIKIKGEPKTYPAGQLIAGEDVPIGKFKIYGGKSNFQVYSSTGRLQVNIILGGSYGVDEYIYTFKADDKIEASSSFKLVEVE